MQNFSSFGLLSAEQVETRRLDRLVQQIKKTEHLASLIDIQNNTIKVLQQQNDNIIKLLNETNLEHSLVKDKLVISKTYCRHLADTILRQMGLIQRLRHLLLGNNLFLDDQQRNMMLQQIEKSESLYQQLKDVKKDINLENSVFIETNTGQRVDFGHLQEQNILLKQKYKQLCKNYSKLNKEKKLQEYELMNYKTDGQQVINPNINQKNMTLDPKQKLSKVYLKQLILQKDDQIATLNLQIQSFKLLIKQKDELIKEHRKNQNQQKKLLHCIKSMFNLEGKQLKEIASTHHHITQSKYSKLNYQEWSTIKNITDQQKGSNMNGELSNKKRMMASENHKKAHRESQLSHNMAGNQTKIEQLISFRNNSVNFC